MRVNQGDAVPGTQSIGRAMEVLRAIALHGRRGCRLDDIIGKTMLSKTTCVRVLNRLCTEQVVRKQAVTGKYYLGPLLHELGMLARPERRLADRLAPMLERLANLTQDTVYLSERSGQDAVCTVCRMGNYPIKVLPLDTGLRRPLGVATGGLAILASLPEAQANAIVEALGARYARYGDLNDAQVRQRLAQARILGYATGASYGAPGATSVSVGLPGVTPAAAISITALNERMHLARQQSIVSAIQTEVERFHEALPELGVHAMFEEPD